MPGLFEQAAALKNKTGFQLIVVGSRHQCTATWTADEQGNGCLISFHRPVGIARADDRELRRYSEVQVNGVVYLDLGAIHNVRDQVTPCSRDAVRSLPWRSWPRPVAAIRQAR